MGRASTYIGVTLKTIFLIAIVILSGFFALKYAQEYLASDEWKYTLVVFGSLAISIITYIIINKIENEVFTIILSLINVVATGVSLGVLSGMFELYYEGIVNIAITATFVIFGIFLLLFLIGLFRVDSAFLKFLALIIFGASAVVLYMSIIDVTQYSDKILTLLIVISSILVIFAIIELYFDFEYVKDNIEDGCDKFEEWQLSIHLVMGLINLYIEILRLIYLLIEKFKD